MSTRTNGCTKQMCAGDRKEKEQPKADARSRPAQPLERPAFPEEEDAMQEQGTCEEEGSEAMQEQGTCEEKGSGIWTVARGNGQKDEPMQRAYAWRHK